MSWNDSWAQTIPPSVTIRAAEHPGYGRLVLDSNDIVRIQALQKNERTWDLQLNRSINADPGNLVRQLPNYIEHASLDPDGLTLRLKLRDTFRLERSSFGTAQIFDWRLSRSGSSDIAQSQKPPSGRPPARSVPQADKSRIDDAEASVQFKISQFSSMARLTFWGDQPLKPVSRSSTDTLSLNFNPEILSPRQLLQLRTLDDYIESYKLDNQNRRLEVHFKPGVRFTTLRYLNLYIIDLSSDSIDGQVRGVIDPNVPELGVLDSTTENRISEVAGRSQDDPVVRVRVGEHPDFMRLVFDWSTPVNYIVEHRNDELDISFGQPGRFQLPSLPRSVSGLLGPLRQEILSGSSRVSLRVPQSIPVRHQRYENRIVIDLRIAERNPVQDIVDSLNNDVQGLVLDDDTVKDTIRAERGRDPSIANDARAVLYFDWIDPVGAALFQYRDAVWVVFDARTTIDIPAIRRQTGDFFSDIRVLPSWNATVLRLVPRQNLYPSMQRLGYTWLVRFDDNKIQQPLPLRTEVLSGDEGLELHVPAGVAGLPLTIIEPETYERLLVGTIPTPGYAITQTHAYPGLQLPVSQQGLFALALDEGVTLTRVNNRFIFSRPGGLAVSPFKASFDKETAPQQTILDVRRWQILADNSYGPSYMINDLILSESESLPGETTRIHKNITELYLALARYPEAYYAAKLMEPDFSDPTTPQDPAAIMLLAASAIMRQDREMIRFWINRPELRYHIEAKLWRGVDAALNNDWQNARSFFLESATILNGYSDPLAADISLLQFESLIRSFNREDIDIWLSQNEDITSIFTPLQQRWFDFLRGHAALQRQQLTVAYEIWSTLAAVKDRAGSHAKFQLVKAQLDREDPQTDTMIGELERLRISWRGDDLELNVLAQLGELYANKNEYDSALSLYRKALSYFPDHPRIPAIRHDMLGLFRNLFRDDGNPIAILDLLALYSQFQELVPSGPDGDRLTEVLADRLFQAQYINEARDLYERLFSFRLRDDEQRRMSIKLAITDLALNESERAEDVLIKTDAKTLPITDVRRQDVALLQSYLLASQGRNEEAVNNLSGVISLEADLLRRDVALKESDWPALILALERLTGPPPDREDTVLPGAIQRHLINWAIALRKLNDRLGLSELAVYYRAYLPEGDIRVLFDTLTETRNTDVLTSKRVIQSLRNLDTLAPQTSLLTLLRNRYFTS